MADDKARTQRRKKALRGAAAGLAAAALTLLLQFAGAFRAGMMTDTVRWGAPGPGPLAGNSIRPSRMKPKAHKMRNMPRLIGSKMVRSTGCSPTAHFGEFFGLAGPPLL
jgi:hypothetical protein